MGDTYSADFADFVRSVAVIVVYLLDSVLTDRLDGSDAHAFLVVVVVALFLLDEELVAVARKVRR